MSTEWRWVDIDGTEHVVGADGLTRMLQAGALPPYTLVWKTTWLGWHKVSEVPDLATSLGRTVVGTRIIPSSTNATTPPPVPGDRYSDLSPRPTTLLSSDGVSRAVPPAVKRPPPRPPSLVPSTQRGTPPAPGKVGGRSTLIGMAAPGGKPPDPPPPPAPPPGGGFPRSTVIGMAPPPPLSPAKPTPSPPAPAARPQPASPAPSAIATQPVSAGAPTLPMPVSGDAKSSAPIPIRDVQPTLTEEDDVIQRATLRPAVGGAPPPPRAAPQFAAEAGPYSLAGAPTDPAPPALLAQLAAAPGAPSAAALDPHRKRADLASTQQSATGREDQPVPSMRRRGQRRPQSHLVTLATGVSFLIPGTVLLALALMRPSTKEREAAASAASASAAAASASAAAAERPAPSPAAPVCAIEKKATRIADTVFFQIPLLTATSGSKIAVGFATSKSDAKGILVDPADLSATDAFNASARGALLGVVPLTSSGTPSFAVDESDKSLAFSRTVDAKDRFSIGVSAAGFARRSASTLKVLWPGKAKDPTITTPRVAASANGGFGVTFRHGGQSGKVLVGWLDEKGNDKTPLAAVPTDSSIVGTPVMAIGSEGAVVAYAAKGAASEPYTVELSRVPLGGAPEAAKRFSLPSGGPGQEAISPSVGALSQGRFLLQWTEGAAGNRAVRAQVLSADLVPSGDPITLSSTDQNAGQGALWVGTDHALALFLSKTEAAHELWGALLKCR